MSCGVLSSQGAKGATEGVSRNVIQSAPSCRKTAGGGPPSSPGDGTFTVPSALGLTRLALVPSGSRSQANHQPTAPGCCPEGWPSWLEETRPPACNGEVEIFAQLQRGVQVSPSTRGRQTLTSRWGAPPSAPPPRSCPEESLSLPTTAPSPDVSDRDLRFFPLIKHTRSFHPLLM